MPNLKSHVSKERDIGFMIDMTQTLISEIAETIPYRGSKADLATIQKRGSREGYFFFCRLLPSFVEDFLNLLEGRIARFSGFKLHRVTARPVFLSGLTDAILLRDEYSNEAMKGLYAIGALFSKFRDGDGDDVDEASTYRTYYADAVQLDANLGSIDLNDPLITGVLRTASILIYESVGGLPSHNDPEYADLFIPRPGPGATNTSTAKSERYRQLRTYEQLEQGFADLAGWFTPPFHNSLIRSEPKDGFTMTDYATPVISKFPTSRFAIVPKKWGKKRGICIEENEVQYLQQGIRRALTNAIESSPITKGRVNFTDQDINKDLALTGSIDRESATVDFSAASDRILRQLVEVCFGRTQVLEALLTLSTTVLEGKSVDKNGKPIRVHVDTNKFAPMGSALCFPVMGLIHWALIRAIIVHTTVDRTAMLADVEKIFVYGDDIVLPSTYYDVVSAFLPLFGMKVNLSKSYSKSFFRESCGGHYYNGLDITPVYVYHTPNAKTQYRDSTRVLSTVAKEHRLRLFGYHKVANTIREWMDYPLVPISNHGVGWINLVPRLDVRKFVCKRRWNLFLQCYEYNVLSAVSRADDKVVLSDRDAMLRWFCLLIDDASTVFDSYDDLKIVRRWVPESGLGCT